MLRVINPEKILLYQPALFHTFFGEIFVILKGSHGMHLHRPSDYFILCANQIGELVRNQRGWQGAKRLFFAQASIVFMLAMLLWGLLGRAEAFALGLGGLVWLVPQIMFAWLAFSDQRARFAEATLKRIYRAEALKLILSASLFALIFKWGHVLPLMFFLGYGLAHGIGWFAPLFFRASKRQASMSIV